MKGKEGFFFLLMDKVLLKKVHFEEKFNGKRGSFVSTKKRIFIFVHLNESKWTEKWKELFSFKAKFDCKVFIFSDEFNLTRTNVTWMKKLIEFYSFWREEQKSKKLTKSKNFRVPSICILTVRLTFILSYHFLL